jgi:hypothetical protein
MLIRRIYVAFLILLVVTAGYHVSKKNTNWKWSSIHPGLPLLRPVAPLPLVPIDISPKNDITVMYAYGPITPTHAVRFGYHQPLHQVISRRRHNIYH